LSFSLLKNNSFSKLLNRQEDLKDGTQAKRTNKKDSQMVKLSIIGGVIFLILTFLTVKFTLKKYKKENSEKMWKLWGIMYWQAVILIRSVLTFIVMMLLKWCTIITF
jgi:magnesium-transporting ATPase (P-type)